MKKMERFGWALALLTVVAWGASRDGGAGDDTTRGSSAVAAGKSRDRSPGLDEKGPGSRSSARSMSEARQGREMGARARQALRHEDPLRRMAEFLKLLGECHEGNIDSVADAFAGLKASGIILAAEESLLDHRIGQLGGGAIFGKASPPHSDAELARLKDRFKGWAQEDSFAAKRWLESLPQGRYRDEIAVAYISTCAAADPAQALSEAASLPEELKGQAGRAVAEHLVKTGSMEDASLLLEGLEAQGGGADEQYLGGIFEELLNGAVKGGVDPASLVERHLDRPYVDYPTLVKVSVQKAKADPVAALEWAAELEGRKEGVPDGGVLAATLGGMSLEDLDRAEEWALANSGRAGVDLLLPRLERQREALDSHSGEDSGQ